MSIAAITGLGAVTSVGMDAATTCASIRAGLTRPALLDGLVVVDLEAYEEVPVTGHPAGTLGLGFCNIGRWLQLAAPAIDDLCQSARLPAPDSDPGFWSSTLCYIVAPALDDRFLTDLKCSEKELPPALLGPLLDRAAATFRPSGSEVRAKGRVAAFEILASAAKAMQSGGPIERVIIVAVDSLVDPPALAWLAEHRRLKSDANPVGLSPGEAACAMMVEHPQVAKARAAKPIAQLAGVSISSEPLSYDSGEPSQGEVLARVVREVLSQARLAGAYTTPAVADLNGEVWRASELALARVRVPRTIWASDDMHLPAASTGDVGAAMGLLQMIVACRALVRGHAHAKEVLVCSTDTAGQVGAAVVRAN